MRISIAMATFNGAIYIQEQLVSLSNQTFLPYELVVCDDGSTDDTLRIVHEFARSAPFPVRIYQNETNLGFADNFLHAASLCEGEWIGFCDQDDVWLPHKLTTVEAAIVEHDTEHLMLVVHSAFLVRDDLSAKGGCHPYFKRSRTVRRLQNKGFLVLPGFACVFNADLVREINWTSRPTHGHPPRRMQTHDTWICLLANTLGDICYISETLALYRRHEDALTGTHSSISTKQQLLEARRTGESHYIFLAAVADDSADFLHRLADTTGRPDWADKFQNSAEFFKRLSHTQRSRAAIYAGPKLLDRLRIYIRLHIQSGYFGHPFFALGWRSAAKDAIQVILGRRFSEEKVQ